MLQRFRSSQIVLRATAVGKRDRARGADLNGAWHLCNAKIFTKLMQNTPGFRTIEPGDYLQ
jgi:hypothetical protein